VLYLNHKKDEASVKDVKIWTKEIIDAAIENNGTYYLTYSNYASREQFKKAYPEMESFFNRKSLYDPHIVFTNKFYEEYKN
jgi:FAD/FMN-containing dehydrogenase